VLRIGPAGEALHVEQTGTGRPVLLLHGFTGSTRTLDDVAGALRAAGRSTIAADLLGHGDSDAPHDASRYIMERCIERLVGVLDATASDPVDVLGYSLGGRVALGLAVAQPERVRGLVLIGASAGLADPAERAARRAADEALAETIERDGVTDFVERWLAQPLFASQARLGRAFRDAARAQRLHNRVPGLAGSLRGLGTGAQPSLHAALAGLPVPLLLAVGAEDAKFRAIAEDLARRAPRARIAVIPDAGHAAHLENPSAFLAETLAFLNDLDDRRSRP
jgi:2-succinyl-6-hydroxy-2,4-cyclohexadiene-1-carboxylate synthase